jgi:DnaJ-class molecular chaperone
MVKPHKNLCPRCNGHGATYSVPSRPELCDLCNGGGTVPPEVVCEEDGHDWPEEDADRPGAGAETRRCRRCGAKEE